jgi:hypothetical protein
MLARKPTLPRCARALRPAWLALLASTAAACALIEPAPDDAQLPVRDAGPSADEESEAEGARDLLAAEPSVEARGSAPQQDAHEQDSGEHAERTLVDAASDAPDAGSASDAGPGCEADWQCGPDAYCSRVRQLCSARCEHETCLGPAISDTHDRLVSDGTRVCFADDSEAPGSGDFALRTWDGVAPRATTLTRAREVRALLLDAQYCYFHADGALRRAALSGGCVELLQEMAEPPSRIWSSAAQVSWSTASAEVYRVAPQLNARAERVEPDVDVPSTENVYGTSATLGERLIQRHAAEGRLQAMPRPIAR